MVHKYAYIRVSTTEQNEERQVTAIREYCKDIPQGNIFTDKASGKNFERPQYEKMKTIIEHMSKIDGIKIELIVEELDRLGRNSDGVKEELLWFKKGSIIFLMGLASNVLGYRHPAAILDRSKNKCCGLITDGEELKNNQLCFSVDTTVLHLFSDLSRTCPRTSGGWIPPLALTPKNNRSVSFLVA